MGGRGYTKDQEEMVSGHDEEKCTQMTLGLWPTLESQDHAKNCFFSRQLT